MPTIHPFSRLKRASHRDKAFGKAPHKPVLLLAVLEAVEAGHVRDNRIDITPQLVAAFQRIWLRLVDTVQWQPRFYLPFFHLSGDGFWHLELMDGARVALTDSYFPKSVVALQNSVAYAHVVASLWAAMAHPVSRGELRAYLLDTYFPGKGYAPQELRAESEGLVRQLDLDFEGNTAVEPAPAYMRTLEVEARCAVFKIRVPQIYNYTCAISGLRVISTTGAQMVDACHILPWSSSKDDTIQNGICLTPTIHRAFDHGLIRIDADYRVVVADTFVEHDKSPYNFRQFHGKQILLPREEKWWPSREGLAGRMPN